MVSTTPYVPVDEKGWRLTMGLRPLDDDQWLEIDESSADVLAQKAALLREHYDDVVATTPEGDEASAELLSLVRAHLQRLYPDRVLSIDPAEHPLVAASRLIPEDVCVLVREDAWRLRAACVCFPSRWRLQEKMGATLDGIHAPVPGYEERLARPTTLFFDRLRPDRGFWRLNWTVLDRDELFQPSVPATRGTTWFVRVERQTFRLLPNSRAAVFTIRTYVESVSSLVRRDENFLTTLTHALAATSPDVQRYKGWVGLSETLASTIASE